MFSVIVLRCVHYGTKEGVLGFHIEERPQGYLSQSRGAAAFAHGFGVPRARHVDKLRFFVFNRHTKALCTRFFPTHLLSLRKAVIKWSRFRNASESRRTSAK